MMRTCRVKHSVTMIKMLQSHTVHVIITSSDLNSYQILSGENLPGFKSSDTKIGLCLTARCAKKV
jgi:hypothetical protein